MEAITRLVASIIVTTAVYVSATVELNMCLNGHNIKQMLQEVM